MFWMPMIALAVGTGLLPSPPQLVEAIWIEGERPTTQAVSPHPWWYDQVKKDRLSGGDWIHHFDESKPGEASYAFSVPAKASYRLWLRANATRSKLSYRLDAGPWTPIHLEGAFEVENIAADGAPDLRFIAWIGVGPLDLAQGAHTLSFQFGKPDDVPQYHGGIDAIVLATGPFAPRGLAKPGNPGTATRRFYDQGVWAFEPAPDDFSPALLDLSHLNEKVAGQTGPIRKSVDGMSFVRGDGKPIRFWGVVSDAFNFKPEEMEAHARFLAKRGVNMVRLHTNVSKNDDGAQLTDVDGKVIDGIQRWVSVAKRHGIYTTISPYWAHGRCPASWGIDGYSGEQPWGVLFFNAKMQAGYKAWARALYEPKNPYTGIPLKDDPSIMLQVKNEDSLLFWTFDAIKDPQKRELGRQYFQWAKARYGSLDALRRAWGEAKVGLDDFDQGVAGFFITWDLTQPQTGAKAVRCADQTEFLTWRQRKFYSDMAAFYRNELGCKQPINAMNWRSADQVLLDDAERYSYTATDFSAVNYYTGGVHVGENNGYRIDPGHSFTSGSVLRGDIPLPCALKQTVGSPMTITETAWVNPNLYQTEGPFLMSAYQSLSGVDTTYWFAYGKPTWEADPRALFWPVGDSHATFKWFGNFPGQFAQFPAYALAYRQGYIQEAKTPAVYEERSLESMWRRNVPIVSESGRFDPNRDHGSFAADSPIKQEVPREAFFVGPVHVKFGGQESRSKVVDLAKYIDRASGDVRSLTGELVMNTKRQIATIDAPKIQGVAGFLQSAGGAFKMSALEVASTNDYAVISAVSLDGQDLRTSKKVLVQVGTTTRLSGFETRETTIEADGKKLVGEQIVRNGVPPWMIANTKATVTLRNPVLNKATLLVPNGRAKRSVPVARTGPSIKVELPPDSLYLLLE